MEFKNEAEWEAFIETIERSHMIKAPVYMKEEILKKVCNRNMDKTAPQKILSKRVELFFYGVKVSAALAAALVLLAIISIPPDISFSKLSSQIKWEEHTLQREQSITETFHEKSNKITGFLGDVSEKFVSQDFSHNTKTDK